jgi:hypothetical protein
MSRHDHEVMGEDRERFFSSLSDDIPNIEYCGMCPFLFGPTFHIAGERIKEEATQWLMQAAKSWVEAFKVHQAETFVFVTEGQAVEFKPRFVRDLIHFYYPTKMPGELRSEIQETSDRLISSVDITGDMRRAKNDWEGSVFYLK